MAFSTMGGAAPRRRKIATYGKPKRTSFYDLQIDSSPEKPRRIVPEWTTTREPVSHGYKPQLPKLRRAISAQASSQRAESQDPDSPSSAGPVDATARPTKVTTNKHKADEIFDVPSSDDEATPPRKAPALSRPPPAARARSDIPRRHKSGSNTPTERALDSEPTSDGRRRQKISNNARSEKMSKPTTTARVAGVPIPRRLETSRSVTANNQTSTKRSHGDEVFDVPSSDDDATPPRRAPVKAKASVPMDHGRKRQRLSNDSQPVKDPKPVVPAQPSKPQDPKNPDTARLITRDLPNRPAQGGPKTNNIKPTAAQPTALAKPRRTKTRVSPAKPSLTKGQSAPAGIRSLVPSISGATVPVTYPSPLPSTPSSDSDDDFLRSSSLPPEQSTKHKSPTRLHTGSTTPKQRKIWGQLLDSSFMEPSPSALMGNLKIRDRTPAKPLPFRRTVSDMPRPQQGRKRLIDTLKQDASDEMDEDSETGDEDAGNAEHQARRPYDQEHGTSDNNEVDGALGSQNGTQFDSQRSYGSQPSQSVMLPPTGPRVTYSKQRSYLEENKTEDDLLLTMPLGGDSPVPARSQRGENSFSAVTKPSVFDFGLEDDDSNHPIKSIHELRAAGGSRRLADDVWALVEDLKDSSAAARSRRRSAMIELATMCKDPAFVASMIDHGLDTGLYSNISDNLDTIFDFALAIATAFIVEAGVSAGTLQQIHASGATRHCEALLDHDKDIVKIAKERRTNMSKAAQGTLAEFVALVKDSSLFSTKTETITPRLVGLKCLDVFLHRMRSAGQREELIGSHTVSQLLSMIQLPNPTNDPSEEELIILKNILSTLEMASLGDGRRDCWSPESLSLLADILPALLSHDHPAFTDVQFIGLRLCLTLTNNDPDICEYFSKPALVLQLSGSIDEKFKKLLSQAVEEEQYSLYRDGLILALGAMINLTEFSDAIRAIVATDGTALLDSLLQTFLTGLERAEQADSEEESQIAVALGWLTVLLGNLCQHAGVRARARAALPGRRLTLLIAAVEQFIRIHQKADTDMVVVDDDAGAMDAGGAAAPASTAAAAARARDVHSTFTERLQAVVDRLKDCGAD